MFFGSDTVITEARVKRLFRGGWMMMIAAVDRFNGVFNSLISRFYVPRMIYF